MKGEPSKIKFDKTLEKFPSGDDPPPLTHSQNAIGTQSWPLPLTPHPCLGTLPTSPARTPC